eukprot:gene14909-biopygen2121
MTSRVPSVAQGQACRRVGHPAVACVLYVWLPLPCMSWPHGSRCGTAAVAGCGRARQSHRRGAGGTGQWRGHGAGLARAWRGL